MFPSVNLYLAYHGELVRPNAVPQYIQIIGPARKSYLGAIVQVDGHRESRLGVLSHIINYKRVEVVGIHNNERWTATVHIGSSAPASSACGSEMSSRSKACQSPMMPQPVNISIRRQL